MCIRDRFIRSLVGLDRKAAQRAFNEALTGTTLTAQQIDFVERIIDQLTASGAMDPARLYEPPYTDSHPNGIGDVFPMPVIQKVIATVRAFEPRYAG